MNNNIGNSLKNRSLHIIRHSLHGNSIDSIKNKMKNKDKKFIKIMKVRISSRKLLNIKEDYNKNKK